MDGRILIERLNGAMLNQHKATPAEYKTGLDLAIERGWLELHESGTFVRFTQAGADLLAWRNPPCPSRSPRPSSATCGIRQFCLHCLSVDDPIRAGAFFDRLGSRQLPIRKRASGKDIEEH